MNDKTDKELDDLIERIISYDTLESPSVEFTNRVVSRVEGKHQFNAITYSPLISKPTWLILGVVIFGILGYFNLSDPGSQKQDWIDRNDLDFLTNLHFMDAILNISIPSIVTHAVGVFAIVVLVHIIWLVKYFDKHIILK